MPTVHTLVRTYVRNYMHACTRIHNTRTHKLTHTYKQIHARARTHARTHALTHTHTHTHTQQQQQQQQQQQMRLTNFADDANVVFRARALEGIDRVTTCSPVKTWVTAARIDVCNPTSRQHGDTLTKHVETLNKRRLNRLTTLPQTWAFVFINKYAEGRERGGRKKEKDGESGGKGEGCAE